jgi:hypothetical protein
MAVPARPEIPMRTLHRILLSMTLLGTAFGQTVRVDPNEGSPLLSASLSLQLARSRILEARPEPAAEALRDAVRHLAGVEALFPGPEAEHAGYMREQILEQTARIHDNPSEIIDRIDYLWLAAVYDWLNNGKK